MRVVSVDVHGGRGIWWETHAGQESESEAGCSGVCSGTRRHGCHFSVRFCPGYGGVWEPICLGQWGTILGRSDGNDNSCLPSGYSVPGVLSTGCTPCSLTTALGVGTIMPILHMKERKPRQVQGHAHGLPTSQWPGGLRLRFLFCQSHAFPTLCLPPMIDPCPGQRAAFPLTLLPRGRTQLAPVPDGPFHGRRPGPLRTLASPGLGVRTCLMRPLSIRL